MTNRIMFDGLNINTVPTTGAEIIAYYVDVVNSATVAKRFPNWRQNPIDRHGNHPNIARTFDVERGLINASDLEVLITDFNEHNPSYHNGARPVVYCNRSTIASVRQGTGKYVLGRNYYLWVATLDGTEFTGPGVIACQNHGFGGYDSSVVYDSRFLP